MRFRTSLYLMCCSYIILISTCDRMKSTIIMTCGIALSLKDCPIMAHWSSIPLGHAKLSTVFSRTDDLVYEMCFMWFCL